MPVPTPSMSAEAVIEAMTVLRAAGITAWIGGGWGIDALVGEQTRVHRDLDLAIRSEDLEIALRALTTLGYETSLDLRPVRLVVTTADGRSIDLHPVTFGDDGVGRQPGDEGRVFEYPPDAFGDGTIAGVCVPTLTAEQLVRFHLGYEPLDRDRHDMALLRDRLGVEVPPPY
jgi:lincosamide nucleotidyltransferase A/C/D/E